MPQLEKAYSDMIDDYYLEILKGKSHNAFFGGLVRKIEKDNIAKQFCDCGIRYIAIGVDGSIYPCEGFIGVEDFKMGSILNKNIVNKWACPQNVEVNDECRICWAKYLCGGSCYHEAWMRTGSVNKRDKMVCETYRIAVKYALQLYLKLQQNNIKYVDIVGKELLPEKTKPKILEDSVFLLDKNSLYTCNGGNHRIIQLNETASDILKVCDGKNNISEIVNKIYEKYECQEDIYSDVSDVISSFLEDDIIKILV